MVPVGQGCAGEESIGDNGIALHPIVDTFYRPRIGLLLQFLVLTLLRFLIAVA